MAICSSVFNLFSGEKLRPDFQALLQKVREFKKKNPSSQYTEQSSPPASCWDPELIFSRQSSALDFCALYSYNDLHIFSFDAMSMHSSNIYRKYLVANTLEEKRHYYELIPEGFPCKLYFDVEYAIEYNLDADGEEIMRRFKHFVTDRIYAQFNISVEVIVDLDSSTDSKFSRHLIFNLENGRLWKNNFEVGKFVAYLMSSVPHDLKPYFFVNSVQVEKPVSIVDQAVYSKNRTFRIWLSSKLGKSAAFKISDNINQELLKRHGPFKFFLYSLVCAPISNGLEDKQHLSFATTSLDRNVNSPKGASFRLTEINLSSSIKSPFPLLDEYILKKAMHDMQEVSKNKKMVIRKCQLSILRFHSFLKLIIRYDLSTYRFCDIVNKIHKSNNVQIHVIIDAFSSIFNVDTSTVTMYRKCLDPDCSSAPLKAALSPIFTSLPPILLKGNRKTLDSLISSVLKSDRYTIPYNDANIIENDPLLLGEEEYLSIEYN